MSKKNLRKAALATMATTAAAVAAVPAVSAESKSFSDVKPGSTHYDAIQALTEAGVIQGYSDGTFGAWKNITRNQVATIFQKALKLPVPANKAEVLKKAYSDITVKSENSDAIAAVTAAGIFGGNGGKFGQWTDISREQMASVVVRALDLAKYNTKEDVKVNLSNVSSVHRANVQILANLGITKEVNDFRPTEKVQRAAFSSFVYRAQETVKNADIEAPVLTVNGDKTVNVEFGGTVVLPEVTGKDNKDEKVEVKSVITDASGKTIDKIDTKVPGTYKVTYSATDAAGNKAEDVVVTVTVKEEVAPKVESVKAINGKTVEVKFTQPVKKSTVITTSSNVDYLNGTNVAFDSLDGKNVATGTTSNTSAEAELSEDGKTLTVTAGGTDIFEGRYHTVVDNVETTKSEKLPKYDEVVNLGKDTTAPAVASVEKINASTSKVTFTEAIANLASATEVTYSFKLADGTVVPNADVTVTRATDGKSLTISADATKYAGKVITATMLGAKDHAGNLINPNPSTFDFQVGTKDGVAPTIVSSKALSPTKIEVNFSEEVQGFNTANAADLTLTGATGKITTPLTATKIEQDSKDKKKYIVTLSASALDGATKSAVADLKIVKTHITDLSGEAMANDYSAILTVKLDTVAPKLVSTKVVAEAGTQYLVIDFDKELDATPTTAVAPVAASASSYKDYVTVSGKNMTLGNVAALTDDNKGIKVKLSNDSTAANLAQFDGAALVDGTKYTFDVKATDVSGNTSDATKVEFTYNGKADSSKPALVSTTPIVGDGQNTITVEFDKELDGASATNAANYKIAGVPVEKAVLSPVSGATQKVTLTLGQNTQSGDRSISISGVKSKAGVAMDTYNGTVTLKENVKPTVTAAKVTATNKIELTFSENVVLTGTANFDVFIGDSTTAETAVSSVAETTTNNKTVITLTTALTDEDLAKTITVKPSSAVDVKDAAGNVLDFKSIVVAK